MQSENQGLVSTRVMEVAVGALLFALGAVLIVDANRLGWGWGSDGPQSGYFPFYIGLILCFSSVMAIIGGVRGPKAGRVFVERGQAKLILSVFLPSVAFVLAIAFLGIYVASALFIAGFMAWQGKFGWLKCATIAILVAIALFMMFEVWFKVPLPKGPLEALIGY